MAVVKRRTTHTPDSVLPANFLSASNGSLHFSIAAVFITI